MNSFRNGFFTGFVVALVTVAIATTITHQHEYDKYISQDRVSK
jgi:hypothetical protein